MPFVGLLVLLTTLVYLAGNPLSLALWPVTDGSFRPWQLITYAFVHGGLLHYVVNMVALLSFGPALVRAWGAGRFMALYTLAAALGGVLQVATMPDRPVVGASAALFGLFVAYVFQRPQAKLTTLWPWPLPAWKVLVGYAVLTVAAAAFGWASSVAHVAHLGGMFVGLLFAYDPNNKPRR
jgi:rhomboid family protein